MEKVLEQTTVEQQDPFPSETRDLPSSESDMEEFSVEVQTGNWADHMEFVEGLAKLEPEDEHKALSSGLYCIGIGWGQGHLYE